MNWKLSFQIAVTHLVSKPKQSVIAMLGVMFGISMFIIMISFMTGVNQFLEDMAMDNTPHVRIYKPIEIEKRKIVAQAAQPGSPGWYVVMHQKPKNDLPKLKNGMNLVQQLEDMPEVYGVAPQVSSQVFYSNGPVQIPGNIYGIAVKQQDKLFGISKRMDMGDRVNATTPDGGSFSLKVVGIFSFGIAAMDETRSYATIATVQKILQKDPSYITDINIKLKDIQGAHAFKEKIDNRLTGMYVEDWEAANASLLAGDKIRNILTAVVCATLLIVAGFGIYNIMNMNIINKMKDIAILKATGFQSSDITGIFLFQSLMIGLAGGLLGLLIGFCCSYLLSITPFPAGAFLRIKTFPVNFKLFHYLSGVFFGFVTTLLAGYFPAKRASQVDPVQIIRG